MYGTNVLLTVLLASAVTVMAVWAAGRVGGRMDLSSAGRNSLSPRTVQLLNALDTKVTITSTYTSVLKDLDKVGEKHRKMVADLLDLYETSGGAKVSTSLVDAVKSPSEGRALLKRLVEKPDYKDEAKPHEEAIKTFPALMQRVAALINSENEGISALARDDPGLGSISMISAVQNELNGIQQNAIDAQEQIKRQLEGEIPRFGAAVEQSRKALTGAKTSLNAAQNWMSGEAAQIAKISETSRTFFKNAPTRYKELISAIEAELTKTGDLKPVKFEELYNSLKTPNCILIETEKEAAVIPQYEVFVSRGDRSAPPQQDGDTTEFNGETAISSTILKLTQKTKTGVVFVRHGGQPMLRPDFNNMNLQMMRELPRAPFGMVNEIMGKENFAIEEWDVAAAPAPPELKDASKIIYVVFPPSPPEGNPMMRQQQMGMTPEQKQAVLDAVRKSGMAIFMAGWSPPRSRFDPTKAPYEYNDYLKSTWGIDVKSDFLAMQFGPAPEDPALRYPKVMRENQFLIASESHALSPTEHEIIKPLQTTPFGLDMVCPLELPKAGSQPAGVKLAAIVEVPQSDDLWAFSNFDRIEKDLQSRHGTIRYPDDYKSSFPVAVAATNDQNQRAVIFASDSFMADSLLRIGELVQVGGQLAVASKFPGNGDLFINSLHWLSGDANRISVGPAKSDVPRLDGLKEGTTANFLRAFIVGIWPACAGLVGLVVWTLRRK